MQSKPRATQILQMLLQCTEADPAVNNHRGFNVFQFACLKGCQPAVTCLLDMFVRDREEAAVGGAGGGGVQRSPTNSASRQTRRISIELLTAPKQDGFSPLHIAALNDHAGIVEELLARGAPVDQRNNKQQTPLMLAASSNNLRCIELLVEKGAMRLVVHRPTGHVFMYADTSSYIYTLYMYTMTINEDLSASKQSRSACGWAMWNGLCVRRNLTQYPVHASNCMRTVIIV